MSILIRQSWIESYRKEVSPRLRLHYWRAYAGLLTAILRICFRRRTRNRAEHIHGLEEKCAAQARAITYMRREAEVRNAERKAMNILVGCDGPCNSAYMDDPGSVTEDVVRLAERNALRLRHWWDRGGKAASDAYRAKWARKTA